jgi:hypothetical protein
LSAQIFSDGIGTISIIGGIVRIDFVVLSPTEKESNGQPKAIFQQQLVMGAEAFLRSTEKMQGAAQALVKIASQQATATPPTDAKAAETDHRISSETSAQGIKPLFP